MNADDTMGTTDIISSLLRPISKEVIYIKITKPQINKDYSSFIIVL